MHFLVVAILLCFSVGARFEKLMDPCFGKIWKNCPKGYLSFSLIYIFFSGGGLFLVIVGTSGNALYPYPFTPSKNQLANY